MTENQIRVLLVDDEEELIDYLSKRLLREGFTIKAVRSGLDAIEAAKQECFDAAIVDLKMPGMDGLETMVQLKKHRPFFPCIMLTGHGSVDAALASGRSGAFLFLEKPADHEQLIQGIHQAATKKKEQVGEKFQEEMVTITTAGGTPHEILAAVEALREKYRLE